MPRQVILTPDEQRLFDTPPILNNRQRIKYFGFSSSMLEIIQSLRTPTTQVCFLVQLGYFRAAHRFFASGYHALDVVLLQSEWEKRTARISYNLERRFSHAQEDSETPQCPGEGRHPSASSPRTHPGFGPL